MTIKDFLQGKWLKHPLHPALVHITVSLWPAALLFDLISYFSESGNTFVRLSFYSISLGMLGALLAIPPGLADWADIKSEKPAWKIGLYHMGLNFLATVIFAINLGMRLDTFQVAPSVSVIELVLTALATGILVVSTYLGGRMIYQHGINVARQSKHEYRHLAEAAHANVPKDH